jgi:hypothetical protein
MKNSHACSISFEVESDEDHPTRAEIMASLKAKVLDMENWDDQFVEDSVEVFDTIEND